SDSHVWRDAFIRNNIRVQKACGSTIYPHDTFESVGEIMSAALALTPKVASRLFLGVERSVGGRPWRDRLDERATTRALAIAQRHNVPELLARILAGRGVEVDEVEAFLDPTVRRLLPDPHTVTAMEEAALRLADAMTRGEQVAIFGDYD